MKRLSLDRENSSNFLADGDKSRFFDRLDITAKVYNQFANAMLQDLKESSEQ